MLDDAIGACLWAEACFDPETGNGGIAPNVDNSSCLEAYITDELELTTNVGNNPHFDVFRDCALAGPSTCTDYRQCVADAGVATACPTADTTTFTCDGDVLRLPCRTADGFAQARDCGALGETCSNAQGCVGTCTGTSFACSADGTRIDRCNNGVVANQSCGDLTCADFNFAGSVNATCLPPVIGTCAADGASCDGNVVVACTAPTEVRVDCAAFGRVCAGGGGFFACQAPSTACDFGHTDVCTGDVLTICANGSEKDVDCAALGGTCGQLRSGLDGCLFP